MATQITGRIGLVRAEDSTGCVVAIDGHWFDVTDILAEPDAGLVQLHGFSSTGAPGVAPPGRGRRAPAVPGLPVHRIRAPVSAGRLDRDAGARTLRTVTTYLATANPGPVAATSAGYLFTRASRAACG